MQNYEIGQIVRIVKAIHPTIARIKTVSDGYVTAQLECANPAEFGQFAGFAYTYPYDDVYPTTQEDIENAHAWSRREWEMDHPAPLRYADPIPKNWDAFDEDGVLK
jgi:hypothetical protein